jgi:SAM-dependent methyltransferase
VIDLRRRAAEAERMDGSRVDPRVMAAALRDLDRLAAMLGGWSVSLAPVVARLVGRSGRARVLDLGAGSGAMARELCRRARERGTDVRVVAVDRHPVTCRLAREAAAGDGSVLLVRADATRLPFADGSFALAHASLVLHHLDEPEAALREMRRVAREGFVVCDLERSRLAHGAVWLASRLLARSSLVQNDGPLSVRRGFRRADLERWRGAAGLERLSFRRRPPFRWLAWL